MPLFTAIMSSLQGDMGDGYPSEIVQTYAPLIVQSRDYGFFADVLRWYSHGNLPIQLH
jgi:hypothetical protein